MPLSDTAAGLLTPSDRGAFADRSASKLAGRAIFCHIYRRLPKADQSEGPTVATEGGVVMLQDNGFCPSILRVETVVAPTRIPFRDTAFR